MTKSAMLARDIDVLREIGSIIEFRSALQWTTVDTELARILEPRAPRPDLRLECLRKLREAGIQRA